MIPRSVWDYIRSLDERGFYEIRGWRFDFVGPRFRFRPSVSDITSVCPSKRDVYLRKVKGLKSKSSPMVFGRLVHEAFLYPFNYRGSLSSLPSRFSEYLSPTKVDDDTERLLWNVFERALELYAISKVDGIPVSVEPLIPASAIGLSDHVKPDALVGFIPVEITTSGELEKKELAVAAYALSIEAWIGHPVDYGVIAHISFNSDVKINWKVVNVDDSLRRKFLDVRDRVARMIEYNEDPGLAASCPSSCPFRGVCYGAVSSGSGI
ncbi:MAG: type I-A CRISPR-associated protein Cas4/Csa1 [Acidilobaceae archaeon]